MQDRALTDLAERQLGLVRIDQAAALGLGRRLRLESQRGRWERVTSVVYRVAGSPRADRQMAMAVVLDAAADGAVLSHDSAAAIWDLPGFRLAPFHVTLRRKASARGPRAYRMHEPRLLLPSHLMRCDGLPVTTPARTLFDLAGEAAVHDRRLERAVDTAWAAGLVTAASLDRMLDELACKGRRGIRRMRALLEARGADYRPPASALEHRFEELCRRAGITGIRRQVELGDEQEWIGRVDFVHDALGIVFEIDSIRYHTAPLDAASDRRRDRRLARAGYRVERVTEFDVWHRPDDVVALLVALRSRAA